MLGAGPPILRISVRSHDRAGRVPVRVPLIALLSAVALLAPTFAFPTSLTAEHASAAEPHLNGFDMAAINGGAGMDDWWHGRPSVQMAKAPECDSSCQAGKNVQRTMDYYHWRNEHNGHCILGYEYDFAKLDGWLSFARGIGPSLDPFQPAANDAVNLSSDPGLYGIYCDVHQHANKTSNYDIWLVNFYDGVGSGGWGYQLLFLVLSIVLPIGVAKLGGALVGMLADAVVEETATAVADGTMIAARAGVEAAGGAAAGSSMAVAERALVRETEALVEREGGSVAQAAREGEAIVNDVSEIRAVLRIADSISDEEVLQTWISDYAQDFSRLNARFGATYPGSQGLRGLRLAAWAGFHEPESVTNFMTRYMEPATRAQAESALQTLVDSGIEDVDKAWRLTSSIYQRGRLQEERVEFEVWQDSDTISVEESGNAKYAYNGKTYTYRADRVVTFATRGRVGVEVKDVGAQNLIDELQTAVNTPKGQLVQIGKSRVVKQVVLGPKSNAANLACAESDFYISAETSKALTATEKGRATLAFIEAQGWNIKTFTRIDSDLVRLGTGTI